MQEIHIVGLGGGAQGGDEHDVIGVQDQEGQGDDEGVQRAPTQGAAQLGVLQP